MTGKFDVDSKVYVRYQQHMDKAEKLSDLAGVVESARSTISEAITSAYNAGYARGSIDMRNAIVHAAQASEAVTSMTSPAARPVHQSKHLAFTVFASARAPRGSVREAIVKTLSANPLGLTERELSKAMELANSSVSGRSAGAELRRQNGRLYRQDSGRWFLTTKSRSGLPFAVMETAARGTAVSQQTLQESSDDPDTTITS